MYQLFTARVKVKLLNNT